MSINQDKVISTHEFLFPFKIALAGNTEFNLFSWEEKHPEWIKQEKKKGCENYALYRYFHEEVSRLFWGGKKDINQSGSILKLNTYAFDISSGSYQIHIDRMIMDYATNEEKRLILDYNLDIDKDGITLYILDKIKIGVLSIRCYNSTEDNDDSVLNINQWGRRIFYPFIKCNKQCKETGNHFCKIKQCEELVNNSEPGKKPELSDNCNATCTECAESLTLKWTKTELKNGSWKEVKSGNWKEDFQGWISDEDDKPNYAVFIRELLKDIEFRHIIDDRMFVSCFYKSDTVKELSNAWTEYTDDNKAILLYPVRDLMDYWYKLCFVDTSITCASPRMKSSLLKQITYDRWYEWGTFYAFTRYSFIMFTTKSYPDFFPQHFEQHYHYLLLIALLQRASLISFSDKVNEMANRLFDEDIKLTRKDKDNFDKELTAFRKQYILFCNEVWFDEVTPQDQGIEMYELVRNVMELDKQKETLRNDIEEVYQFKINREQVEQNNHVALLTQAGAVILPLTMWANIISINPLMVYSAIGDTGLFISALYLLTKKQFKTPFKLIFSLYMILAISHLFIQSDFLGLLYNLIFY